MSGWGPPADSGYGDYKPRGGGSYRGRGRGRGHYQGNQNNPNHYKREEPAVQVDAFGRALRPGERRSASPDAAGSAGAAPSFKGELYRPFLVVSCDTHVNSPFGLCE